MQNPYQVLGRKQVYRSGTFAVREDQIIQPGGKHASFAVIEMKSGASALPLSEDGRVSLIREYKYAIDRESLEVASGALEAGEKPVECAMREMREEVGLAAKEWVELGYVDPFTTQLNGPAYLFLARGLTAVDRDPDEGEVIEVVTMPFAEAVDKVLRSEITHAPSCVLILRAHAFLQSR